MSKGYFPPGRSKTDLKDLFAGLITASHILHHREQFDSLGTISVRNPDASAQDGSFFLCSHTSPPSLCESQRDIGEFKIQNGEPTGRTGNETGFPDLTAPDVYIHSEIYARFPSVRAVTVLPATAAACTDLSALTLTGTALQTVLNTTGFLAPASIASSSAIHVPGTGSKDRFIETPVHEAITSKSGAESLARMMGKPNTSAGFIYKKLSSAVIGSKEEGETVPLHPVVQLRGQGCVVAAEGIEEVVFMAGQVARAAEVQVRGMALASGRIEGELEGKVDVGEGQSGKMKGSLKGNVRPGVEGLGAKGLRQLWENEGKRWVDWDWRTGEKEVRVSGRYRCEIGDED